MASSRPFTIFYHRSSKKGHTAFELADRLGDSSSINNAIVAATRRILTNTDDLILAAIADSSGTPIARVEARDGYAIVIAFNPKMAGRGSL